MHRPRVGRDITGSIGEVVRSPDRMAEGRPRAGQPFAGDASDFKSVLAQSFESWPYSAPSGIVYLEFTISSRLDYL